ncbi:MAG: PD-(D/E)XK nuclease family protein [Kiritimatiellae bacterium]|nr:PD-(D/E)XK nuclease family protein [Kiritimatiellia bacterium]
MAELKAPAVSEGTGGHWYTREGAPAYAVAKKDGSGERPTTLRDAKKLGLLPSVTTVLGILDKPQLTTWKVKTAIRAALDVARADGEELEAWVDRVVERAGEPVAEAADLGAKIHDAIEVACRGEAWDSVALGAYVAPVLGWILGKLGQGGRIVAQESVIANAAYGFAGRVDCVIEMPDGTVWIVDWKSRKTRAGETDAQAFAPYATHRLQAAAYGAEWALSQGPGKPGRGWAKVRCANVFTSSTEPGRFGVVVHDDPEAAWEAFKATLEVWRWTKGYDPRQAPAKEAEA